MSAALTKQFIQEKGWEALTSELGIKVKHYDEGVTVLNYCQINSPKAHPVVLECRGLILYTETKEVAARAFDRFFNYGEVPELTKSIDFANADVYEKADGSLIKVYFCKTTDRWEIATRGTAFAESSNNMSGITFRESVLMAFDCTEREFQEQMDLMDSDLTYVFEYVGLDNRIVTRYENREMIMLGVVDNVTGVDHDYESVAYFVSRFLNRRLPCREVKRWALSDEAAVLAAADTIGGLQEGFVVRDRKTGIRTKIKSAAYVRIHHMRGENGPKSPKGIAEVILLGERDEYLLHFGEDKPEFDKVDAKLAKVMEEIVELWCQHCAIESQKDFAMAVKDSRYKSIMFSARKAAHKDPRQAFHESRMDFKVELILSTEVEQ